MLFSLHGGHVMEQALQCQQGPFLLLGSGAAWVLPVYFV